MKFLTVIFVFLSSASIYLTGQTVFTYRAPESDTDTRYDYDYAVLKLALDKTLASHGAYLLQPSHQMNFARMYKSMDDGIYENPMFKSSANNEFCKKYDYVNFPIDLGIVGYRVFFVSLKIKNRFEKVQTLNEIKDFTIIQGSRWLDSEILRSSGFDVREQSRYESLFLMVASDRVDLFPRGINEVIEELASHSDLEGLILNDNIVLYYPLPRFFFTNKGNETAIARVTEGLKKAYEDGSLNELWKQYYQESVDFVDLKSRTFFEIENPLISEVDNSFKKYFIPF